MSISDEELAAFADGELDGGDAARVAQAIAADPALALKVEQHRALRDDLGARFAPILDQPVPDRLADLLRPKENIFDFAAARETALEAKKRKPSAPSNIPRWGWIAGPALAACLVLVVLMPRSNEVPEGYAGPELAAALDTQLVAEQGSAFATRILVSFQRDDGEFCRAFTSPEKGGIACKDGSGWALVEQTGGTSAPGTEYRQAGNDQASILAAAQEMAVGGALDSEGERIAREAGWRE